MSRSAEARTAQRDSKMPDVWVCITARNEAASIGPLVADLREYNTVVIDDGSHDGTGRIAEWNGANVIKHNESQGIGPALMEAWGYALEHGAKRIIQLDAGGSHDPTAIPALLRSSADVVIGSRFVKGGEYHGRWWRALCSRAMGALCTMAQGRGVRDWTSGYRAFTDIAARRLLSFRYEATMHGWQIETLARARQQGLTISEQPICYVAGDSSLRWSGVAEAIRVVRRVHQDMREVRQ